MKGVVKLKIEWSNNLSCEFMIKALSTFLEVLAQHWWLCSRKLRRDEQVAYTPLL
jgi:hypothetical protein